MLLLMIFYPLIIIIIIIIIVVFFDMIIKCFVGIRVPCIAMSSRDPCPLEGYHRHLSCIHEV
jgi:hypothetical protein